MIWNVKMTMQAKITVIAILSLGVLYDTESASLGCP